MFKNARNILAAVAVSSAVLAQSGAAFAATMSFDTLPDEGAQLTTYTENGIQASALGGVLAYESNPGFAHIDDSGTGLAFGADFIMAGIFDAVGFSLVSFGYSFLDTPGPLSDNIFVSGYLGNTQVSSASYTLSDVFGAVQSITLGSAFAGIDRLRIELLYPVNTAACDAPCGHFDLDSVTLNGAGIAPVPLPPTLTLLGVAGFGLWGLGRRKRITGAA